MILFGFRIGKRSSVVKFDTIFVAQVHDSYCRKYLLVAFPRNSVDVASVDGKIAIFGEAYLDKIGQEASFVIIFVLTGEKILPVSTHTHIVINLSL